MKIVFHGLDFAQVKEIEEVAKNDPAKAAKDYKLRKFPTGSGYWIVSKLPNMQGSITPSMIGRSLTGEAENAFLDAIKDLK